MKRRTFCKLAFPGLGGYSLLALTTACSRPPKPLFGTSILDLTASITPEGTTDMFGAVEAMLQVLHRGDSLAIIPVTADEQTQATGRVLRFNLPSLHEREPYDQDLHRLIASTHSALQALKTSTLKAPYPYSDILGAFDLAAEELASRPPTETQVLLCLSDFVQDDNRFNFKCNPALADHPSAHDLAEKLARQNKHTFRPATPIYLGLLPSTDFAPLSHERRQAIQDFWIEYLALLGGKPLFVVDGPGLLTSFLKDQRPPDSGWSL
jgi:hypothetical protein